MLDPVAEVLDVAVATGAIVTGFVAVTSLNPFGPPGVVRSVALVAPSHSSMAAIVSYLKAAVPGATASAAGRLIHVFASGKQVATVSGSSYPADAVVTVPVLHQGRWWNTQQMRPEVLRAQLVERGNMDLVKQLDSFMAETHLQRALAAGHMPWPAPVMSWPSFEGLWACMRLWADAAYAFPHAVSVLDPGFGSLLSLSSTHLTALAAAARTAATQPPRDCALTALLAEGNPDVALALVALSLSGHPATVLGAAPVACPPQ